MACGIPVITTDAGGIPEYVECGITLNRFANISNSIRDKILYYMQYQEQRRAVAKVGYDSITFRYNNTDYINKFIESIR